MAKNTLETTKPKAYGRRVKDIPKEYRIPEIDYNKHANDVIYIDANGKPINMDMLPLSGFKYNKFIPIKNNHVERTIMPSLEDIKIIPYAPNTINTVINKRNN